MDMGKQVKKRKINNRVCESEKFLLLDKEFILRYGKYI